MKGTSNKRDRNTLRRFVEQLEDRCRHATFDARSLAAPAFVSEQLESRMLLSVGAQSSYLYFQTPAASLPAPTIIAPGSGTSPGTTLATLTPQFDWSSVSGASGYGLYVRDVTANALVYPNSSGITTSPLAGTSFTIPSGDLVAGHSYRWAMTSFNGSTEGAQSSYLYFQTPAASLPAPTINLNGLTPNPITADPSDNYQTLTINGTGFINEPSVILTWTGQSDYIVPVAHVTFVSSMQLQISIKLGAAADDMWTARVVNPDGQTSSAVGFTVAAGGIPSPTSEGVDYSSTRPAPTALKNAGYSFAVRYVSPPGNAKNITSSESQSLQAAGVDIILVFESTANRMLDGYAAGVADANTAVSGATAAGAPQDFFCYFACDFDAQPSDQTAINAYLNGAASVLGVNRVGFYGGYGPLKRVLDSGTATKGWQTSSWSNGNIDPRISLFQNNNVAAAISGCDLDYGYGTNLGQWSTSTVTLTAPSGLSVTPRAGGTTPYIDITWQAVIGAANYRIYRNGSFIFTTVDAGTSFSNTTGLVAGQSYTFQVQAINGSFAGPLSNTISTSIPNILSNSVPPAPHNAPTVANLPSEPELWTPQINLQQALLNDSTINQYFVAQSTPLTIANNVLNNPPSSGGWKTFFATASTITDVVGTSAGLTGDLTAGGSGAAAKFALDGTLWALEHTPEYQNNVYAKLIGKTANLGQVVDDSVSFATNLGLAGASGGTDVVNDGGAILSGIALVSGDILSPTFDLIANDPPDPNYSQVFVPENVVNAPLNPPSSVPADLAALMLQTVSALDQTLTDVNAVQVTGNRYGSALAANDSLNAGMQYLAFLQYLGTYSLDAETTGTDLAKLASLLQTDGIGTNTPTATDASTISTILQTQGTSVPGVTTYLEAGGFTDSEIQLMLQQALANPAALPTESVSQALGDLADIFKNSSVPTPTRLAFGPSPLNAITGTALSPSVVVYVEDANGNVVDTDNSNVTLSLASGPSSMLNGTISVAAVKGVATFDNLSLPIAGTYTLAASDGGLASTTSQSFMVAIPPQSGRSAPNAPSNLIAKASSLTSIHLSWTLNGGGETSVDVYRWTGTIWQLMTDLRAGATSYNDSDLQPNKAYYYTVVAGNSNGESWAANDTQATISIKVPYLIFATEPIITTAGYKLASFTITIHKASGSLIQSGKSTITLKIFNGPSGGKLLGTTTIVTKNGVGVFSNLFIQKAGSYQFKVTSPTFSAAISTPFTVRAAATQQMVFKSQPNNIRHGNPFNLKVELLDRYGNLATGDHSALKLTLASHPVGAVFNEKGFFDDGFANFNGLLLDVEGNYSLQAIDGKLKATSKNFKVT
ncbi:MAG TPA: glycoside hydrolase domain-containing protein [Tepidisphaeraceae bacterium]|nr:glycoside hydrolase domain-containing protein [Tepidisphaeraceae bacterium]